MIDFDDVHVPSPEEIEQFKSPRGGWTRHVLEGWGVEWPPREGWKDELIKAYRSGFTMGVVLECIGCREARFFVDYDPYPICDKCQKKENEKYEREHGNDFGRITMTRGRYKKEPIPADLRWAVFERDNFTCQRCGSRRNLSVDHIIPESKGGVLNMENTQTLCKSCNSKKGARA